ncbi:DUF2384 domain-containing protein [Vibrio parahaemolyticus]|uniref:DUF2384 domain-containing protein n=1 Tax=Vibrio parahaemolyticus TaxID=670 RepID=UPI00215C1AE1|nr:DUF2384 domain-containing protein [Vibrio parahaemolyticus]MCR9712859.1 DUF2384 domain-containing protein [Vibrio parahaemolyticus]
MMSKKRFSEKELVEGMTPYHAHMAGFKAADNILSSWDCTNRQIQKILNISKLSYDEFKTNQKQITLSNDQLVRVSYILNIHNVLRVIFNNSDNVKGFMSMRNHNDDFSGRSPIQVIESGILGDLQKVYKHIDRLQRNGLMCDL